MIVNIVMDDSYHFLFCEHLTEIFKRLPKPRVDSRVFIPLAEYYNSLPKEITESYEYKKASSINGSTKYEDVLWIISSDISNVNVEKSEIYIEKTLDVSSKTGSYIREIVTSGELIEREKIVIILSVFESFLHSKVEFLYGTGIKPNFRTKVLSNPKYSSESLSLSVIYAIVNTVFANTSDVSFDRRLPHRNDILHNGTIDYSDEDISKAYQLLLAFICIIDDII